MDVYVALFRGINVGGNNILPMKQLSALLESLGLFGVKTYIQSGNAAFASNGSDADTLSAAISREVKKDFGFSPKVLVLARNDLEKAMAMNPFPEATEEPKSLHFYFLTEPPAEPDLDAIEALRGENERIKIAGPVAYLHAPDGIGRSKLAAKLERLVGVPATARNLRTVTKILELASEVGTSAT